jgi:hypothetical protein
MAALLMTPFAVQALAMAVDEGWFHRRRGLPRWERLGHPVDTLTVALTYAWALASDPRRGSSLAVYVGLAAVSCLVITKDEPVHRRVCPPGECWVHALLFILHPVVFLAFALLWRSGQHRLLLELQLGATIAYGLYQLIYWNVPWRAAPR